MNVKWKVKENKKLNKKIVLKAKKYINQLKKEGEEEENKIKIDIIIY